ncbi:unnamed protein product [[Candida] boidinii]|nr:unnamed protein product [[Candida] boidinii]
MGEVGCGMFEPLKGVVLELPLFVLALSELCKWLLNEVVEDELLMGLKFFITPPTEEANLVKNLSSLLGELTEFNNKLLLLDEFDNVLSGNGSWLFDLDG